MTVTGGSLPCKLEDSRIPEGEAKKEGSLQRFVLSALFIMMISTDSRSQQTGVTGQETTAEGCSPALCRAPPCVGPQAEAQYHLLHRSSEQLFESYQR